jgi:ABC-2 type transport system ATP-binding protein
VTVISTANLSVRYRRRLALNNCTLKVPSNRITALVGENGAGKTTFLNCAVGLQRPTSGTIEIFGGLPAGSAEARERVAYVGQESPLYRNLSVANMLIVARELNREFDLALATTRITELDIPLSSKVGNLSGGQQAQVGLTLALARHPDVLILDEPLAGLDPRARRALMREILAAAADDQVTVLYSSHVVSELERAADYLIILERGKVRVATGIEEFLADHRVVVGSTDLLDNLPKSCEVLDFQRAGRQVQALICDPERVFTSSAAWELHAPQLEDLVLAYLTPESDRNFGASDERALRLEWRR